MTSPSELTDDVRRGLGVGLNEADFCDVRINEKSGEVRLLFVVLTLPASGPEPSDRRRVLSLVGVRRITAALRKGERGDATAPVAALRLRDLPATVRSFGSRAVYGWDFIDVPNTVGHPPSLDFLVGKGAGEHSIDLALSSSDPPRHLDLRVEFDGLAITDGAELEVPVQEFIDGGRRWWAALQRGDPRVAGHGISAVPSSPSPPG